MADDHKLMKNITGQEINERLREIRNILSERQAGIIYGFHIDGAESDPEDAVVYLEDAVGMTPARMDYTNSKFDYGSWRNAFFMPRPCMLKYDGTVDYYLDPNDYSKKEDGATASDIADADYDGNAMMEWGRNGKKIWYKIVPDAEDATSASVYIADYQADEGFHAWSFINSEGNYVDHFYTPIYNGSLDSSGRLRSLSGKSTLAGSTTSTTNAAMAGYVINNRTAAQERTAARKNNENSAIWDTEVYADNILIELLLILISKSLDSQTAFGKGLTDSGSQTVNDGFTTGIHNAKGMFYGTNSGTAGTPANAVKVFGMENFWGFQWRRFGGLVNDKGTARYKMTRGMQDGSNATDYVVSTNSADYSGYLEGAAIPASISGTYIDAMNFDKNQFTPKTAAGSSSTHYCDGLWTNNNQVDFAFRGGGSDSSLRCGAFSLGLNYSASFAYWFFTASLSCKPLS